MDARWLVVLTVSVAVVAFVGFSLISGGGAPIAAALAGGGTYAVGRRRGAS